LGLIDVSLVLGVVLVAAHIILRDGVVGILIGLWHFTSLEVGLSESHGSELSDVDILEPLVACGAHDGVLVVEVSVQRFQGSLNPNVFVKHAVRESEGFNWFGL